MNSANELKFTVLVFQKKKINCTGFSREKKTVHFNEQYDSKAWLHRSVILLHKKQ
jgi:hypothetical protein